MGVLILPLSTMEAMEATRPSIPAEAIAAVASLSQQVSSPGYVRTPQFTRHRAHGRHRARGQGGDTEWVGSDRNRAAFKATILRKRDGMEGVIDRVRKHLNKISDRTYEALRDKAFRELSEHEGAQDSLEVSTAVFNLLSSNAFYAGLYARFYTEFLARFPAMRATLDSSMESAASRLAEVVIQDPKGDYDAFCEQNKRNATNRARAKFYVQLAAQGVIHVEPVMQVVRAIQDALLAAGDTRASGGTRDELAERLFEMVTALGATRLEGSVGWAEVKSKLEAYARQRPNAAKGISGKSVFRHMDILEGLQKLHAK